MPAASPAPPACVLVTGATGFLGKVVVAELLRRHAPTFATRIVVLVRGKRGQHSAARFAAMLESPCFGRLSGDWRAQVAYVDGNLAQNGCGLSPEDAARLAPQVTHIIHCAASVDFDLPLRQAAESNVVSSLNMLAFAQRCPHLRRMVSVSTAYVTPHRRGPLPESLAPLPVPAATLLAEIEAGGARKEEVLLRSGHPNTYTLTKCIAEHLLCARRGAVDLRIVRPSIIAAAWQHPWPGWIDSNAALAGFVASIGAGLMHVVDARAATRLDVVPVDTVATRIIDEAFDATALDDVAIRYAVAELGRTARIDTWLGAIVAHFRRYPMGRRARVDFVGARGWRFTARRLVHQELPARAAAALHGLRGRRDLQRQARRLGPRLDAINRVFPYFTHRSFDFRATHSMPADFDVEAYVALCCTGVMQYLMGRDPTEVSLGGRRAPPRLSDVAWALSRPRGNWAVRLSSATFARALRRMCDSVTFDQRSFETARAALGDGRRVVVVPTHRSYMDFLLCSFLFFARPDLRLEIPYVAAAQEFSHIQVVGWLFRQMHAFYLRRNAGREDPELTEQVHALVRRGAALQFFIEGQRSRSRHFLPPRRGLLRCLQNSGEDFVVLPISICYDRVPEEASFARELQGYRKDRMQLRPLLRWSRRMARGEVALGRVHIACGTPQRLGPDTDVPALSRTVMAELQARMAVSTYHLRAFLAGHPELGLTQAWLRDAVVARGGRVIDSALPVTAAPALAPPIARSLQNQFAHLFVAEALAAQPDNPALAHTAVEGLYVPTAEVAVAVADRAPLAALQAALFAPTCADYARMAAALAAYGSRRQRIDRDHLLQAARCEDYTAACAALRALEAQHLVATVDAGHVQAQGRAAELQAFAAACAWQPAAARRQRFRPRLVTA